jgi:hypothetical protein
MKAMPGLLCTALCAVAFANYATSPIGRWKTFDDHSGQAKSIVSIYLESGELQVRVDSLLPAPGKDPNKICEICPGERKGKRIRGMVVGWGLKPRDGAWEDGRILDPGNGKIYRCRITLNPDGKTLTVRGYIGVTWLGRSQKWERVE